MPIDNFFGDTFVAFLDICGFKKMVSDSENGKAASALNEFFGAVYKEATKSVGIYCVAVSDCAIAFVGKRQLEGPTAACVDSCSTDNDLARLNSMLEFVRHVSESMIDQDVAISGSIAYGSLQFMKRYEGERTVKALFLGRAYLEAYNDFENGRPKLKPGQIRIVKSQKTKELVDSPTSFGRELSLVKSGPRGYYFYWMLNDIGVRGEIDRLVREYSRDRAFDNLISVLRNYSVESRRTRQDM
jgi:hypothetical protein